MTLIGFRLITSSKLSCWIKIRDKMASALKDWLAMNGIPESTIEPELIKNAALSLKQGELLAFPTETVYGLGADASNPAALEKLYALKGRPRNHPLIVHVSDIEAARSWCSELPEAAIAVASVFWPGPLTLVLKKAATVPELLCGGQETIALRSPSHPVAQALLKEFNGGIAAPSANRFGKLSPTCADDVRSEFSDTELLILDGGPCEVGIESTILDLSGKSPRILRPGMIQEASLMVVLSDYYPDCSDSKDERPRVPGDLPRHYSPATSLKLFASESFMKEIENLEREGKETAVLSFQPAPLLHKNWINAKLFAAHYAHNLYRNLRKLDSLAADLIAVELPPETEEWSAILDRLRRAAAKEEASGGNE